jgi:hypothetical protein
MRQSVFKLRPIIIGLVAFSFLFLGSISGYAQSSKASMQTQIANCFPTQLGMAITPAGVQSCLDAMINSYQQYASVNAQVGTSYVFQASDYGQLVTFNNSGAIAATLPQASGSFATWNTHVVNNGSGVLTITPTISTINGASSLTVSPNQSVWIVSDGANYQVAFSSYSYIAPGTGNVVGSNPSTIGCAALWADTSGTLLGNNCGQVINATFPPYSATGNGTTNDYTAIQSAINAASAAGGGVVFLPQPSAYYAVGSTLTIPAVVTLVGVGAGDCIKPSASITDVIKIVGNNLSRVSNLCVANLSSNATNGIDFDPAVAGNNVLYVDHVFAFGFVDNYLNTNADRFVIQDSWSQSATGHGVHSLNDGQNSIIDNFYSIGDVTGIYYAHNGGVTTEGVTISNSGIYVTTGYAIQFDQGLFLNITNTNTAGPVYFNGSVNAIANVNINSLFVAQSSFGGTHGVGVNFVGNIADVNINGLSVATYANCGLQLQSTASLTVQRVSLQAGRFLDNGTAAGSADLCIDATNNGVANVTVANTWFESVGGSVVSVLENNSNTITASFGPNNVYFGGITTTRSNVIPVSGGVPFINSNLTESYSAALAAGKFMVGGGAGVAPATITLGGDCSFTSPNVTCNKTGGTAFGTLATLTPGTGVATALGNAVNGSGGLAPVASPAFTGTFNINGISGAGAASKYVCIDSGGNMLTQSGAC